MANPASASRKTRNALINNQITSSLNDNFTGEAIFLRERHRRGQGEQDEEYGDDDRTIFDQ